MVLRRADGSISHEHFYQLIDHLHPGDCLVMNDSRVIPARLLGHRIPSGGAAEVLLLTDKGGGSAAAPTAGLHFTTELLQRIAAKDVRLAYVTLHVGLGTFRPVKVEEITEHEMHSEFCMISAETAQILNETKQNGGRIVCVGTTSCRTVESLAKDDGSFAESSAWTDIFIYPGYRFKAMDALITNFHLPESTLIMLVSAFAGYEHIMNAYRVAVQERYRFFSFGDAMFLANL